MAVGWSKLNIMGRMGAISLFGVQGNRNSQAGFYLAVRFP